LVGVDRLAPYKGTVRNTLVWTTSSHYAASAERAGFHKQADIFGRDVSSSICSRFQRENNNVHNENVEIR